jgi:hypothetical protein
MLAGSEFAARTVRSAAAAAHFYFDPLEKLLRAGGLRSDTTLSVDEAVEISSLGKIGHGRRDIREWEAELARGGYAERAEKAEEAKVWVSYAIQEIDRRQMNTAKEYDAQLQQSYCADEKLYGPHILHEPTTVSRLLRWTSWALLPLEFFVCFVIYSYIAPVHHPVLVSLFASVMLIFLGRASIAAITLTTSRPGARRRRLLLMTGAATLMLLCILATLSAIRVSGRYQESFPALLLALFFVVPTLAGLMQASAEWLGWSERLSRQYQELMAARSELEMFRKYADFVVERGASTQRHEPQADRLIRFED